MAIQGVIPDEIREGPGAIRETVSTVQDAARAVASELQDRGVRRIWVLGNGTSYHSSLHAATLAQSLAQPDDPVVISATAGAFMHFRPNLGRADAVIGISASGEFRDLLKVIHEVAGQVPTVGITHVATSTLARLAAYSIVSGGGPSRAAVMTKTFSATLAAANLLIGAILGDRCLADVATGLRVAAHHADRATADDEAIEELAGELAGYDHMFVVGGGFAYAAALEVALKLKEMASVHAEASETWEMASGPATMIRPGTVVVAIAPPGEAQAATSAMAYHSRQWGARVVEVAPTRTLADSALLPLPSDVDERFAPLTTVPAAAMLAYVLGILRGASPDKPSWVDRYRDQGLTHIIGAATDAESQAGSSGADARHTPVHSSVRAQT